MLLIVDNYDSFTYNLYQMLGALHPRIEVVRNDRTTVEAIAAAEFDGIILSPGPGTPDESGVCLDILRELEGTLPILGVCLGHQAICQTRGASIVRAEVPVPHGQRSRAPVKLSGRSQSGDPVATVTAFRARAPAMVAAPVSWEIVGPVIDGSSGWETGRCSRVASRIRSLTRAISAPLAAPRSIPSASPSAMA